jgi:PAS domain S-box-containing protein
VAPGRLIGEEGRGGGQVIANAAPSPINLPRCPWVNPARNSSTGRVVASGNVAARAVFYAAATMRPAFYSAPSSAGCCGDGRLPFIVGGSVVVVRAVGVMHGKTKLNEPADRSKEWLDREPDRQSLAALRAVFEATAGDTGEKFLQTLVRSLAGAIDVQYAFVAEFAGRRDVVRTIALWAKHRFAENVEYALAGTPCQDVVNGGLCHHPNGVCRAFPDDVMLADLHVESYLGVPLLSPGGEVLGHLAVFDERPLPEHSHRFDVFRIFAARAAAELERLRIERQLLASEERFRDLFDEAPIAYVYEDTDTRFVSANRAAMKLLGLKPEDVPGTVGMTLVAPNQVAQERVHDAFADIRQGKERGFMELELRRKDNGEPVWVQFWSRPEPDGKHTRTMIVDITARVLAEREKQRLQLQNQYLREEIQSVHNFEEIVGHSPALQHALRQLEQVAPTDATVLILGESGTGKELIARAIHHRSKRRDRPLIKLNCAALPTGLVESELFGHEKGAFTGAIEKRVGRFSLAQGGTIFLDEIGDMPLEVQSKLLRVLQEREFEPVGATSPIAADVRVIAATNRELSKAVVEKTFREDLFYRLNVFPIHVPPLRERRQDIPLLANYFVGRYANQLGKEIENVDAETLDRLVAYPWPGNIRELQNVLERAVILTRGTTLEIDPRALRGALEGGFAATAERAAAPTETDRSSRIADDLSLERVERDHIRAVLMQTGWRVDGPRGAAAVLGLHPNTLRSRMKKLGISRP